MANIFNSSVNAAICIPMATSSQKSHNHLSSPAKWPMAISNGVKQKTSSVTVIHTAKVYAGAKEAAWDWLEKAT